jgi:hypothetical protein
MKWTQKERDKHYYILVAINWDKSWNDIRLIFHLFPNQADELLVEWEGGGESQVNSRKKRKCPAKRVIV